MDKQTALPEYLKLIPAFQSWSEQVPPSQKLDWKSYQSYIVRIDQSICILDLFWPEFVEKDGFILRKSSIPNDWKKFKLEAEKADWSHSDIEYIINHLNVADFFLNDPDRDKIDSIVYTFLGHMIADMWKCKLQMTFPDISFEVAVSDNNVDPEVYACTIE